MMYAFSQISRQQTMADLFTNTIAAATATSASTWRLSSLPYQGHVQLSSSFDVKYYGKECHQSLSVGNMNGDGPLAKLGDCSFKFAHGGRDKSVPMTFEQMFDWKHPESKPRQLLMEPIDAMLEVREIECKVAGARRVEVLTTFGMYEVTLYSAPLAPPSGASKSDVAVVSATKKSPTHADYRKHALDIQSTIVHACKKTGELKSVSATDISESPKK
jgi:hypothetical protein